MQACAEEEGVIVTHALGSCLGISVHDGKTGVGGLLHTMLPLSTIDTVKAEANPFMFVDTGVPALFQACYRLGSAKERLVLKVAGGSRILDGDGRFNIGQRNYTMLRKILWKNGVMITAEDVGGMLPRTMSLDLSTGAIRIRTPEGTREI
jgi:chemotaxis protein CheD